ncbi:phosphopantetheine-binding protein [Komagataeibacter xylinus]|uniref:phosphopantetheine-binding protein n=1 Tax=Komagataeibacter xylinus TaxID=28448 RepID=UPI0010313E24|nr:phosphopantetheine-binding protein [Komagataeibacter xylinus]
MAENPPSPSETEVAALIVETLQLDMPVSTIDMDAPLFGDGLGLDSIDALELSLAIKRQYGVELRSDTADKVDIFRSVRSLTHYIAAHPPS